MGESSSITMLPGGKPTRREQLKVSTKLRIGDLSLKYTVEPLLKDSPESKTTRSEPKIMPIEQLIELGRPIMNTHMPSDEWTDLTNKQFPHGMQALALWLTVMSL